VESDMLSFLAGRVPADSLPADGRFPS
jgi:hypothetical protein